MSPTGIPYEIIRGSSQVFTITGTIALEAALLGKEVTIFNFHPSLWINNIHFGFHPVAIMNRDKDDSFTSALNYQFLAKKFSIPKNELLNYLINEN